jgi:hypothetical protein
METTHPAERIDQLIAGLSDWRGQMLASVRKTILEADPSIAEEWKWMGSPVWSRHGTLAVGNAHKDKVKLTFAHGASLADPHHRFNADLGGKVWRAIDLFKGDEIDANALRAPVCAAIDHNQTKSKKSSKLKAHA